MDEGLKRRLIGAAVLASLAVIFVPMLFEEPPVQPPPLPPLPKPPPTSDFASEMLREEVPAVTPLAPYDPPPAVVTSPPAPYEPPSAVVSPPVPTMASAEPVAPEPEPAKPRIGLTAWVVQAASLSSRENADKLAAKLRDAGLPTPDPELVDIKGKRFYRVRVGPVIERSEAEGMVDKVSEIAGAKAQVRQYP
jgi:DedD protein